METFCNRQPRTNRGLSTEVPATETREQTEPEGEADPVPPVHARVAYVWWAKAGDDSDGEEGGERQGVSAGEGVGSAAGDALA